MRPSKPLARSRLSSVTHSAAASCEVPSTSRSRSAIHALLSYPSSPLVLMDRRILYCVAASVNRYAHQLAPSIGMYIFYSVRQPLSTPNSQESDINFRDTPSDDSPRQPLVAAYQPLSVSLTRRTASHYGTATPSDALSRSSETDAESLSELLVSESRPYLAILDLLSLIMSSTASCR